MATWTSAELRDAVLERLNIKAPGQSAEADDAQIVDDMITGLYSQLRKANLVPFASSAIEDWAWQPLTDYVAAKAAPSFGFSGQRLMIVQQTGREGYKELQREASGEIAPVQVRTDFF